MPSFLNSQPIFNTQPNSFNSTSPIGLTSISTNQGVPSTYQNNNTNPQTYVSNSPYYVNVPQSFDQTIKKSDTRQQNTEAVAGITPYVPFGGKFSL